MADDSSKLVAAEFRISRFLRKKKRMMRQRRSNISVLLLPFAMSSSSSSSPPSSASLTPLCKSLRFPNVIEPKMLRFLFQKELRHSDVGALSRIVLPKGPSEVHLPNLDSKEGIYISMDDIDGVQEWNFKYRYWPNNKSRMYVLENTGDFIRTHDLRIGDFLMLYRDDLNLKYVIRGRKSFDLNVCCEGTMLVDTSVPLVSNTEVKKLDYVSMMDDDSDMPFSSFDNTFTGLNLNLPDFFPMEFPNIPSFGTMTNFGSFDSFSLDDFC
ncbi:hypothetical protein ACHQM5_007723 [Ranunculus cassubicifolius]